MRDYIQDACEILDTAMFSSDGFHDKETIIKFHAYIDSWLREMIRITDNDFYQNIPNE